MEISSVLYERESKRIGGVQYIHNHITYTNGQTKIRLGIQKVLGNTITEMAHHLKIAIATPNVSNWWSLQTTSEKELKAAYQAGFRHPNLIRLEQHLMAFRKYGGTLLMERIEGGFVG